MNDKGQLGTASAVAPKSGAAPLSGIVRRLDATVKRQQRQNETQAKQIKRQGKETRALRAANG